MIIFHRLRSTFPNRAVEWGIGYMLTTVGSLLLFYPGLFNSNVLYSQFLLLAPQPVWGIVAFTAGLLRLAALYINGAHYQTPMVRVVVSFISAFIWFWVCVALIRLPTINLGLAIYPWLVIGDAYSVFRASSDSYEAWHRHQLGNGVRDGRAAFS